MRSSFSKSYFYPYKFCAVTFTLQLQFHFEMTMDLMLSFWFNSIFRCLPIFRFVGFVCCLKTGTSIACIRMAWVSVHFPLCNPFKEIRKEKKHFHFSSCFFRASQLQFTFPFAKRNDNLKMHQTRKKAFRMEMQANFLPNVLLHHI